MFKDKTIIITGGANGIGRGIAIEYGKNRGNVVIADINRERGVELESYIKELGGEGSFHYTDVGNPEDIIKLMEFAYKKYGAIDILINNAGISKWYSTYEMKVEEWDNIINVNLRSVFLCSREAAKYMKENGGGAIVNIASTRAFMSEANTEAYSASKGGIIALTHALAISLSKDNIRVNSISPGWIETEGYSNLRDVDHAQHPSNRVGKPRDIARCCFYLTNDENDFINGENIVVDGGMTRKMIYEY